MKKQIYALCRRPFKSLMDNNIRITRSVSKVHSLIGFTPPVPILPARVNRRRWTSVQLVSTSVCQTAYQTAYQTACQTARQTARQKANQTARRSIRVNSLPQRLSFVVPEIWCVCRQPDTGTPMIFCENTLCTIKWFHFNCMRISFAPKGNWFCPNCTSLRNK